MISGCCGSDLAALASLDEPVRARLYALVSDRGAGVTRDDAAAALGIQRALAAYHLDKLVDVGLLTASSRRPPGRGGPGAGRPAKVYARSARDFSVTVPPRANDLAADLLLDAVASPGAVRARQSLAASARSRGVEIGRRRREQRGRRSDGRGRGVADRDGPVYGQPVGADEFAELLDVLREQGFEPFVDCHPAAVDPAAVGPPGGAPARTEAARGDGARTDGASAGGVRGGTVRLGNCPFHGLVGREPEVVCGMNLALIEGVLEGLGAAGLRAVPDRSPRGCCVSVGGRAA